MRIPVFVSRASILTSDQQFACDQILELVRSLELEPLSLGQSDYPIDAPLGEVVALARHCAGGLILGFSQMLIETATVRPETQDVHTVVGVKQATPWNQLEAGVLYALGLPLLVFREAGIEGGVFDLGSTDLYLHGLSIPWNSERDDPRTREVLRRWEHRVSTRFHSHTRLEEQ
jgi:hypothetical protein